MFLFVRSFIINQNPSGAYGGPTGFYLEKATLGFF